MADIDSRGANAVIHEELQVEAAAPAGGRRVEVIFGGGGDPLVFGLPVFVSGSLVLGFALIGLVPIPGSLGSVLGETNETLIMFFMAWTIIFVFLTLGILRLPISYVLILVGVDIAVLFVLLAISFSVPVLFVVAGAGALFFWAVGLYAFLNTAWVAVGAQRAWSPLGPPVTK